MTTRTALDPAGSPAEPSVEALAARFVDVLRMEDVTVSVDATITYCRALATLGLTSPAGVYWSGRCTLVQRREDLAAYDHAFARFWLRGPTSEGVDSPNDEVQTTIAFDDPDAESGQAADDEPATIVRSSPQEVLRTCDLAACTPEELNEAFRLIEAIRLDLPVRRSRRPARGGDRGPLDTRRTVRRALRTGGDVISLQHRAKTWRRRRLVLLCDVSGSMEPYARALLRFLHVLVTSGQPVEAFAFATRLTRLTGPLRSHHPDEALKRAGASLSDYRGGTRLGEVLGEFNTRWGVRGLARGSVVVIVSDGWDRGDPDELAAEMRRLARVTASLIWVNPLKASPGYQPLARGMAAALPSIDIFLEGHSVAALEGLARTLSSALRDSAEPGSPHAARGAPLAAH
jgi:uncharacterized protein